MQPAYQNLLSNWSSGPDGVMKGSRIEGFTNRSANPTLHPDEPALYRIDITIGSVSTPAVTGGALTSSTGSKLRKKITGVSQVFLSQLQWNNVSGVATGDGYCRFILNINGTEIFNDQSVTNLSSTKQSGFVVLLESTSGSLTFNPPLPIHTYKDGQGVFGDNQVIELGITNELGAPRNFNKVSMTLLANSKYYQ